ncbi:ARM repeat superfamily protein isoform X2 [Wolffia australiana]
MEDSSPPVDVERLLEAASDLAHYPGQHSDESVKEFLDRYPLHVLFGTLSKVDEPEREETLVSCLEKIFRTKLGASLVRNYMPYVRAGLLADSEMVNCLACRALTRHLENADEDLETAAQLIAEHDIYPLLLNCLFEGNELVAAAALDAIKNVARSQVGIAIIFPQNRDELVHLKSLTAKCSSLARVRVLALLAKLFSLSISVATVIYNLRLLSLFEEEISKTDDMLTTLSALELLYELAESPYSSRFLLKTTILKLLASIISNSAVEPALRSRAVLITGRLLSQSEDYSFIEDPSVEACLRAIDGRLESQEGLHADECECALEALGEIGSSIRGAELLLRDPTPVARHVIASAFKNHERGKQLAALHALAIICGVDRSNDQRLLKNEAEGILRGLIYEMAANTTKHTPSAWRLGINVVPPSAIPYPAPTG